MSPQKSAAKPSTIALSSTEADRLLLPLKGHRHLALAVSGGADSTALMLIAARSSLPVKFSVLTVDHGLRAASGKEAEMVAGWAKKLGFNAHVLKWEGEKPQSGIQRKARAARYQLLAQWCAVHGAEGVVTAHTLEDQAETLIMRLGRGSGVDGLSAMPAQSIVFGVLVLRPLLEVKHENLKAIVAESGQAFIDDPSNANTAFERIRIRKAGPQLAAAGLDAKALALAARRLQRARQALDSATDALEASAVKFLPEGHVCVARELYDRAPAEIRIRLLMRSMAVAGGLSEPPQLSEVERLAAWLETGRGTSRTLGGCRIQRREKSFLVGRERGRLTHLPTPIRPGEVLMWDGRFIVRLASAPSPLWVQALGTAQGHRLIARPKGLPKFVFETLPALVSEGEIVLVPQLGYRREMAKGAVLADVQTAIRRV